LEPRAVAPDDELPLRFIMSSQVFDPVELSPHSQSADVAQ